MSLEVSVHPGRGRGDSRRNCRTIPATAGSARERRVCCYRMFDMTGTPQETIRVLGKSGSPLGYMIRDFLHRSDIPYKWVELRSDEEARKEAGTGGLNDPRLPVCIFPDGVRLEHPTIRQIVEKLGWAHDPSRAVGEGAMAIAFVYRYLASG